MAIEELQEPLATPSTDENSSPDAGAAPGDSSNLGNNSSTSDTPTNDTGTSSGSTPEKNEGVSSELPEEDGYTGTQFSAIYNRFLGKITDDMYMELTPDDTIRDLQNLLTDAISGFEFPRVCLDDYKIQTKVINEADAQPGDFILAVLWQELPEDGEQNAPNVLVERSAFKATLTPEEINILALLMKQGWVQRQVTSIENTRMKYSGSDFKMTSQANHLAKLMALLDECRRDQFHHQRLYKRRKLNEDGTYSSNWSSLRDRGVFK